jgi:hypothetical protein
MYIFATKMQYLKKKNYPFSTIWDFSGIATSIVCALHCLVFPLFFSSAPILGIEIIENVWLEATTLGLSFSFGFLALGRKYKRKKKPQPLILFVFGFLLLVINVVSELDEWLLVGPAAVLITTAHVVNFTSRKL